jgi:putative ABC transport system permease protein
MTPAMMATPAGAATTEAGAAAGTTAKAPKHLRFRAMARVGLAMMLHDRLKMGCTLMGVVFAVILTNQQMGTLFGLLEKNTIFVDKAGADLWIVPPRIESLTQVVKPIPEGISTQVRGMPGVAWADPMLFGPAEITLPNGSAEAITVVGARLPALHGGPANMAAGDPRALAGPDTMIFDDGARDQLGGLNLGSVREVNGRNVQVVGFTWGMIGFVPAYAFAEYDLARLLLHLDADRAHFILVGLKDGARRDEVRDRIQARFPDVNVITAAELMRSTEHYVITRTPIGVTVVTNTFFALLIGFVIVALTTFSAVVDNSREFGTLKAIGATTWDLAKLLFAQAMAYALLGSLMGLTLMTRILEGIRSAQFAMVLPPWVAIATVFAMIVLCVLASSFALLRLHKLEPAMVFR